DDDSIEKLKVFVYELPKKYNEKILKKNSRCLSSMFAAEIYIHRFLLTSTVRTMNPKEANWFYTPVYTTCDLIILEFSHMMTSAIKLISYNWPYWNRTEGADHFFTVPHDFGACFRFREDQAVERGILPLLRRATLVQTFGEKDHVCFKDGSIIIPPYVPTEAMKIPPGTHRSIFVHFSGSMY
ncbi:hypothetical protein M569_10041, partial [Genlisea aurea]